MFLRRRSILPPSEGIDGKYMLVCTNSGLRKSEDYGKTWGAVTYFGSNTMYASAISSDGTLMCTGFGGGTYTSTNYGTTWTQRIEYETLGISVTGDGSKIHACTGDYSGLGTPGYLYRSTNSGSSWSVIVDVASLSPYTYGSFWKVRTNASSAQYTLLTAYTNSEFYPMELYRSSNYDVSWSILTGGVFGILDSAISSTGQYQVFIYPNSAIYINSNYGGGSWTAKGGGQNWSSVDMSLSGQYQVAVVNGGYLYTSSDYGVTWTTNITLGFKYFQSVSTSGTGKYILATDSNYAYVSKDFGSSWETINISSVSTFRGGTSINKSLN